MGLFVLTWQTSLSVRPWVTVQSSGPATNHTVSLEGGATLGLGTSRGGLKMLKSSDGEGRYCAVDLAEGLAGDGVARDNFLQGKRSTQCIDITL